MHQVTSNEAINMIVIFCDVGNKAELENVAAHYYVKCKDRANLLRVLVGMQTDQGAHNETHVSQFAEDNGMFYYKLDCSSNMGDNVRDFKANVLAPALKWYCSFESDLF